MHDDSFFLLQFIHYVVCVAAWYFLQKKTYTYGQILTDMWG